MAPRGSCRLQVVTGAPKAVARYLHYRAHLIHPTVVAQDSMGEFSYMGRYCPTHYTLVLENQQLDVLTGDGMVDFTWKSPEAPVVLQCLLGAPIWGPDWDHQRIA